MDGWGRSHIERSCMIATTAMPGMGVHGRPPLDAQLAAVLLHPLQLDAGGAHVGRRDDGRREQELLHLVQALLRRQSVRASLPPFSRNIHTHHLTFPHRTIGTQTRRPRVGLLPPEDQARVRAARALLQRAGKSVHHHDVLLPVTMHVARCACFVGLSVGPTNTPSIRPPTHSWTMNVLLPPSPH